MSASLGAVALSAGAASSSDSLDSTKLEGARRRAREPGAISLTGSTCC